MNDIDYQDLSQRVEKDVKRQKAMTRWIFFGLNVCFFILALLIMAGAVGGSAAAAPPLPGAAAPVPTEVVGEAMTVPLIFWAVTILFNFITALTDSGVMDKGLRATATSRALSEQLSEATMQRIGEKSKRATAHLDAEAVTVNDEGELVPLDEEPPRRSTSS